MATNGSRLVNALRLQLRGLRDENEALSEENEIVRTTPEANNFKKRLLEKGCENGNLKKKIKVLEERLVEKEAAVTKLQKQLEEMGDSVILNTSYDSSLASINNSFLQVAEEVGAVGEKNGNQKKKIKVLEDRLVEKEAAVTKLQKQVEEMDDSVILNASYDSSLALINNSFLHVAEEVGEKVVA